MQKYNSGCNIEQTIKELRDVRNVPEDARTLDAIQTRENFVRNTLEPGEEENFDDLDQNVGSSNTLSAVRRRTGVMEKEVY